MRSAINLLEQIAKQSDSLTFVYDYGEKEFIYVSAPATKLLGENTADIIKDPKKLLALIPAEDHALVLETAEKLENGAHSIDVTFRIMPADQQIRWFRLKAYSLYENTPGTNHIAAIAEDITEQKIYQQGLLAIKEQKNVILQVLGHDLRTPLNNIAMSMGILAQELNLGENERTSKLIEIVERTCRNSLDMIKQIINLEYMETQEMGISKHRDDLVGRIQNQLDTFRSLDKHGKTFHFYKNTESLYTNTDSVRFMLIVENLLTNAYKFTKNNGVISVHLEAKEKTVLIRITDNGIGIPDKLKPLIFDKFTSARRKGNQGEIPLGLGMHLIRHMVEQLEGKIWFESEEGKGTTFYVELPLEN